MSHLSQNLEKLIQMISIEQLIGLLKQNTNINSNNSDILSLPLVQKVVQAYEEEIKGLTTSSATISIPEVKDYTNDIAKIHEQLATINSNLLSLTDAIKNITINNAINTVSNVSPSPNIRNDIRDDIKEEEEHIRLKIEEHIISEPVNDTGLKLVVESDSDSENEEEEEENEEVSDTEEATVSKANTSDVNVVTIEEEVNDKEPEIEEESEVEIEEEEEEVEIEEEEESEKEVISEAEEDESEVEVEVEEQEELKVTAVEKEAESTSVEEDADEEVFEIEIDDVTYYATSEENGILYAVEEDGEVGKQVGIIKDGEPIFS